MELNYPFKKVMALKEFNWIPIKIDMSPVTKVINRMGFKS